jgi:hypothetical protein
MARTHAPQVPGSGGCDKDILLPLCLYVTRETSFVSGFSKYIWVCSVAIENVVAILMDAVHAVVKTYANAST